jgi:hypothetical protein
MATIFISYRRSDSPQACRVYDWLVQRFGNNAVFMDVAAIPFAVSFPDFIRREISQARVLVALIGPQWQGKIHEPDDPVRMELEGAAESRIPILPLLIGGTPMPNAEELPASLATFSLLNAMVIGVSHDFHTHMEVLLPKIEAILGSLAISNLVISDPSVIFRACQGIISFLQETYDLPSFSAQWRVIETRYFNEPPNELAVTLYLHRIRRLAELLELHFILSFWADDVADEHMLAGWVVRQFEQNPIIRVEHWNSKAWFFLADKHGKPLAADGKFPPLNLKVRASDEDARQVWKMITDQPLRLSLSYVATVSPKEPQ